MSTTTPPTVTKAKICDATQPDSVFLEFQFNPTEFEMKKDQNWHADTSMGSTTPQMTYLGGGAATLNVPMLFDSTKDGSNVRDKYVGTLETLMTPDATTKKPPSVLYKWGSFLSSWEAIITGYEEKFTLFNSDGKPLRAEVSVHLTQVTPAAGTGSQPAQNPTSRSQPRKTHLVLEGETLDWIAYVEYKDTARWRDIAEANDVADPLRLRPGQVLRLPFLT